jgi:hypothetical protein
LPIISKDIKPEDTLSEIARASKLKFKTEVYISNNYKLNSTNSLLSYYLLIIALITIIEIV